jgi:hypothetical protein
VRTVAAAVVVEASELGDVLATAALPHTQGVEVPTEASLTTDDGISQSTCFTFYMELLATAPPAPDPAPAGSAWTSAGAKPYWGSAPEGSCCCGGRYARPDNRQTCEGNPRNGSCLWPQQCSWAGVWAYRRSTKGAGPAAMPGVNVGDVAMINWGHGNDMAAANFQLPASAARATVASGSWAGGVNLTAVRMTEDRAFGWFHAMATMGGSALNHGPTLTPPTSRLVLSRNYSGTTNGLAKFFYVRDTRRAIGLNGFRLRHDMMMAGPGHAKTGVDFADAIGLGAYNFDVKPGEGMGAANGGARRLPSYMWNFTSNKGLSGHAAPFTFPFRAITVSGAPNVLVAGKTIAMTYAANTAAREHLDEWSCGVGAGAAAALMAARGWNSSQMLASIKTLQAVLRTPRVAQPLSWNAGPSPSPSPPSGDTFICEARRCFQSSGRGAYSNGSCTEASTGESACAPLAADEWLLLKAHWTLAANKTQAAARFDTRIKKSERPGGGLPPNMQQPVAKGSILMFRTPATSADDSYLLAKVGHKVPVPSPPEAPPAPITTHSPTFRWKPVLDRSEAFSVVLTVRETATDTLVWRSPPTWHLPSTGPVEEVGGVAVYQGPELKPSTRYSWAVEERSRSGAVGAQAAGSVNTSGALLTARAQAGKAVGAANISKIYQGTVRSILCRIHNGSMPTSVNGGYSGMFTRDSGVQLLGLMELAAARRDAGDVASTTKVMAKVTEVLTFIMRELASGNFSHMPHIIDNPPGGANGIGGNMIDETDQTGYVIMAVGTYLNVSKDGVFEKEHYPMLKRLLNHYVAPGAISGPAEAYGRSTNAHITSGCCAGVPYYNATLGLIVNLNSEASRESHYWNGYTQVTNSVMVEALRLLSLSADRLGDHAQALAWRSFRSEVLAGVQRSLTSAVDPLIAKQTGSSRMYSELRARSQSFSPCSIPTVPTNPDELLTGFSWYSLAPISSFAASVGFTLNATHNETGMHAAQMDSTMLQYRADGFFIWQPHGAAGRAFPMALNYVNASLHQYDIGPSTAGDAAGGAVDDSAAGATRATSKAGVSKPGTGASREVITMGWAWEAAWAAHRQDWARLTVMHEWLALLPVGYPKDADVKDYPSIAEGYDYDCYRVSPDASDDCYHDIANGIMVGWFLWAETISRRALGLSTEVDVDCLATDGSVQTDEDATTATLKTDDSTAMHTTSVAFGDDGQMVITARNTSKLSANAASFHGALAAAPGLRHGAGASQAAARGPGSAPRGEEEGANPDTALSH